jgi:antirestriction protein ArdC
MSYYKRSFNKDGQSAEDKALSRFADTMVARIKEIQTDWEKPWITNTGYPKNIDGRPYSGANALMLMLHAEKEGYDVPVYATFERVLSLNYDKDKKPLDLPKVGVNKGERSFPVTFTSFTVINKDTKERIKFEDYKELDDEEKKQYNVYPKQQYFNVFNLAAQTNLREARPELYQKLVAENSTQQTVGTANDFSFPAVDEMIKHDLWYCPVKLAYQDQAYYSPSKDCISMPRPSQFLDGQSFVGTFFHEATHSLAGENRLNQFPPSAFGSRSYSEAELHAELTSALVCSRYNLTKNLKSDSASYIKSWLENIQESPDFIKTILQDVKKSAAVITQRVDLVQDYINDYQKSVGSQEVMPDFLDLNLNNNFSEPVYKHSNGDISMEPEAIASKFISRGR